MGKGGSRTAGRYEGGAAAYCGKRAPSRSQGNRKGGRQWSRLAPAGCLAVGANRMRRILRIRRHRCQIYGRGGDDRRRRRSRRRRRCRQCHSYSEPACTDCFVGKQPPAAANGSDCKAVCKSTIISVTGSRPEELLHQMHSDGQPVGAACGGSRWGRLPVGASCGGCLWGLFVGLPVRAAGATVLAAGAAVPR